MVHNLVLEDMAPKVVELVVFHIEPLKQRVGLQSDNSKQTPNWDFLLDQESHCILHPFPFCFFQAVLARNKARVLIEQDYVLSIYLSKHNIVSTYGGDYICWHVMFGHRIESL